MPASFESGFFVGEPAWHRLGRTLPEGTRLSVEEGIAAAGLDWRGDLLPLEISGPPGRPTVRPNDWSQDSMAGQRVPAFATVRQQDETILGVVGTRYNVLQNVDAFRFFQPFLDAGEATLHTAGSLHDGKRVWVLAKLNRESIEVADNDHVDKFLLLSNSHDGSTAVKVGFCPIRVVCANTLAMAHKVGQLLSLRHTDSLQTTLNEVRGIINTANERFEATAQQYRLLASRGINNDELRDYVKQVVLDIAPGSEDKLSAKKDNKLSGVLDRYYHPIGESVVGTRNTWWKAYNAVTEYLSYESGRNESNRLKSLWYGQGQKRNRDALRVAVELSQAV